MGGDKGLKKQREKESVRGKTRKRESGWKVQRKERKQEGREEEEGGEERGRRKEEERKSKRERARKIQIRKEIKRDHL